MTLSVVNPITPAIGRTQTILFRPFAIGKWFVLGFSAFLAELGGNGSGGGMNFNCSGNPLSGTSKGDFEEIGTWIQDNVGLVAALMVAVLAIGIGLGLLFTWLGSRGEGEPALNRFPPQTSRCGLGR